MNSTFFNILTIAPPFVIAIVLHEIAHGYAALKFGDSTAKDLGRLTLNPIKHVDPVMTIVLPGLLILSGSPIIFGGAKPVPVNVYNLKNPKKEMAWIALAGPVTNFILAAISYIIFIILAESTILTRFVPDILYVVVAFWAFHSVLVNLVLGIFNLLPVPPLDLSLIHI